MSTQNKEKPRFSTRYTWPCGSNYVVTLQVVRELDSKLILDDGHVYTKDTKEHLSASSFAELQIKRREYLKGRVAEAKKQLEGFKAALRQTVNPTLVYDSKSMR